MRHIDGSHDLPAVLSYGPILYTNETSGTLIALDLFADRWVWWTKNSGDHYHSTWEPNNYMPVDKYTRDYAEALVKLAQDVYTSNGGIL